MKGKREETPRPGYVLLRVEGKPCVYKRSEDGCYEELQRLCHSPGGFDFGYAGSGPADLALAILADVAGVAVAQELCQAFLRSVIASLPWQGQFISRRRVVKWLMRCGVEVE